MAMTSILADMPELWQRVLREHAPDRFGRCFECRTERGEAARWPCLPHRIATEARQIAEFSGYRGGPVGAGMRTGSHLPV